MYLKKVSTHACDTSEDNMTNKTAENLAWYGKWKSFEITRQEWHFDIGHDGEAESAITSTLKASTELHVEQECTLC